MKRIKSGINGLDKLIEGGFPEGSVILVSGAPGTGKTLFGLQFIYQGAKANEPGVYV
ncbi:MAG: ATPase domain-containing protein, partial [Candidatus Aenigmarchaeota archaeon]|nr:ATPase domain-containing protein [Candidatus Aenigmarchaeota archaeon]